MLNAGNTTNKTPATLVALRALDGTLRVVPRTELDVILSLFVLASLIWPEDEATRSSPCRTLREVGKRYPKRLLRHDFYASLLKDEIEMPRVWMDPKICFKTAVLLKREADMLGDVR